MLGTSENAFNQSFIKNMAFSFTWKALLVIFLLAEVDSTSQDHLTSQKGPLHPTSDFSRHTLVKPKIYHGREKRQISNTKGEAGEHLEHVQISVEVDGKDVILDLTLNKQLIPKGFFHKIQQNGKHVINRPNRQEVNHCHYTGKVRGKLDSWAAISTCDGLSGVFYDGTELHYVEKDNAIDNTSDVSHFLYKHSDLAEHNKTCGFAGDAHHPDHTHSTTDNRFLRYKRSTDDNRLIRGPYNANKDSKYVELVLVVDNREYKEFGSNERRVIDHCKNIANIINGLYSPLNIFIALVGVVIWTERDEINFTTSGDTTLTNFLFYRKDKLIPEHPNDNAQLLTKFNFDGGVVGKALKGPICTFAYSGGVNNDHSPVVGLVATTIAHEMGHNFGMEHDTVDCKCPPDDRCIMAPSSSTVAPTRWSTCSLNYLLLAFTHGMDYCLKNKPESLFDSPVCGNGFVEPGEQCDCGLPEHCENPCCNPLTCTLHANASCATGECCDLNTCVPKNAGTICRSADYECDLPEYCTGQSEYCPPDIFKMDTEECDNGKSFCYHGFCRTRTDQCKLLWGETGKSSDNQCYEMNTKGSKYGNCGYNKLNDSYTKCESQNVLCGMLHCKHLNERLEFGMETVSILAHSFINKKGSIIPCRTALVDLGVNEVDPGMTPDGAKCGEGKMCVNQRCMDVFSLRRQSPSCEKDCNGNGWCNSKGHCHCKDGFAPPFCDYPGPGGSEDSGPASDPNARQGVVIALFIIFLGIIPGVALIVFILYYAKYNLKLNWKSAPSTTPKAPGKSRGSGFPSQTTKKNEANHSLLQEDSPPAQSYNNGFFGHHKGFSLTPLKSPDPEPSRAAPPPPVIPTAAAPSTTITWNNSDDDSAPNYQKPPPPVPTTSVKAPLSNFLSKPVQKMNSFKNNTILGALKNNSSTATAPALPPLNPGSTARPIISSPVLESSTSNAKELVSPLKNAPKVPSRSAPGAPEPTAEVPVVNTVLEVKTEPVLQIKPKEKENIGTSTLNRIASFLKPADKKSVSTTATLPKPSQFKAQKVLDRETLRTLKISDPVPQTQIDIAITALPVDTAAKKAVVMRAQSMRTTKPKERPSIQTFGSMRQPAGYKRPLSIPSGARPKSPPPPAPTTKSTTDKVDGRSNYYDDCLNEAAPLARLSEENSPTSADNIYAVIEEAPSPQKVKPTTGEPGDSLGLLGEIVSEIQNRNLESIYSTSTLSRKKKEEEERKRAALSPDSSEYENTSSLYSNMGGNLQSNASTTSSGYILPSALNVPVKELKEVKHKPPQQEVKPVLSSFRKDASTKPFGNVLDRLPAETVETKSKTNLKSTVNKTTTPPKSSVTRQVTPPNLKSTKPSPTRPLSQSSFKSSRSITNSPDLVTSCSTNAPTKGPDVLNGGTPLSKKPSITGNKPAVSPQKPQLKNTNTTRTASVKSAQEKKIATDVKPPVAGKVTKPNLDAAGKNVLKNAARSNSNVASLQQKFEDKNNTKTAPKVK